MTEVLGMDPPLCNLRGKLLFGGFSIFPLSIPEDFKQCEARCRIAIG